MDLLSIIIVTLIFLWVIASLRYIFTKEKGGCCSSCSSCSSCKKCNRKLTK